VRCLFVIHSPRDPRSAVFGYVLQRAGLLEQHGHATQVLAPQDFGAVRGTPSRYWPLLYPLCVARRLARQPQDLVLFHSYTGWATNLLPRGARGVGAAVTQFHGLEPLYYQAMREELARHGRRFRLPHRALQGGLMPGLLKLSCRHSDAVFCLNREELRFLTEAGWAEAGRACIVPNCVEREFFLERPSTRPLRRLLFLGQWQEGKGTRYLAAAAGALLPRHNDLVLWCLGTRTPAERVLRDFPAAVRAQVRVVPEADREGVRAHLLDADVFILPSLFEGASLALLEAMAAGLPIVTTPVGSARDLLQDGASALFVPVADSLALERAVEMLLQKPEQACRLGAKARRAAEALDWEVRKSEYLALVSRIAAGGRCRAGAGP
jgi:glycosyltransferase involved in cell wall biosynthesis